MIVYLISNVVSGKRYVGQTCTSLIRRWQRHVRTAERGSRTALSGAIRKYGSSAFKVETLVSVGSKAEMDFYEIGLIRSLKTKSPEGYNLTGGGEGSFGLTPSEDTRKKMSEAHCVRNLSEEIRRKLSESHMGNTSRLGIPHSADVRRKISMGGIGLKRSEEVRHRMSVAIKLAWKRKLDAENSGGIGNITGERDNRR